MEQKIQHTVLAVASIQHRFIPCEFNRKYSRYVLYACDGFCFLRFSVNHTRNSVSRQQKTQKLHRKHRKCVSSFMIPAGALQTLGSFIVHINQSVGTVPSILNNIRIFYS